MIETKAEAETETETETGTETEANAFDYSCALSGRTHQNSIRKNRSGAELCNLFCRIRRSLVRSASDPCR